MTTTRQPLILPPTGTLSNFDDPPTLLGPVIAASVVLAVTTTTFVAARAYLSFYIVRTHHIEDYLCYTAWALLCVFIGVNIAGAAAGSGRHMWDLTIEQMPTIGKHFYAIFILSLLCQLSAKLSVLFQIKRIFTTKQRGLLWWVAWASIILNILGYTGLTFTTIFQCHPIHKSWNASVPGTCIPQAVNNLGSSIVNIASDSGALLLPVIGVWHLQMDTWRKIGILAVFGIASVALVISIIGLRFRITIAHQPDFTWLVTRASIMVLAEQCIVIIVGCFPGLPRLVRHVRGERKATSNIRSYRRSYSKMSGQNTVQRMDSSGAASRTAGTTTQAVDTRSDDHLDLWEYGSGPETGKRPGGFEGIELGAISKTIEIRQGVEHLA